MSIDSSYRQILHSSSIIGGGAVINITVDLIRIKVAAVLLGPAGVGAHWITYEPGRYSVS